MKADIKQTLATLHFRFLPGFADHLLQNQLLAFSAYLLELYESIEVPLLKAYRQFPEEQLRQMNEEGCTEMLTYIAQNNTLAYIEIGLARWKANALPQVESQGIVAEDITQMIYCRRKAFVHFMPAYAPDTDTFLALLDELDLYLLHAQTASTKIYVTRLRNEVSRHAHLLEKINNTLPGAVYIFDITTFQNIFSNNNLPAVIGYTKDELNALGPNAIVNLLHPEDKAGMAQHLQSLKALDDGEITTFKYRIRRKNGMYHWIRNYEAVFRRDAQGAVQETIGITLNIDNEEHLAAVLKEREGQYKKAEAMANLGHYSYDMATRKIEWTDHLYHIYGLAPQSEAVTLNRFLSFIHPDDLEAVIQEKDRLFREKKINYVFRIMAADGVQKTIRSIAEVEENAEGQPVKVIGTEQDITEKQDLIEQLRKSEQLYKQAQTLAHIGNWSWIIATDEVEWSEQMYHIYELPVGTPLTYEKVASYVHPDDREAVAAVLQRSIATKSMYDKHHRIVLPSGSVKTIHRRAEVLTNAAGEAVKMVGTTQDVTAQKAVEQELRDNQTFIKKIADATPSVITLHNVNTGRFLFINEGLKKLLGYDADYMLEHGAGLLESLIHPEDLDTIRERNAKILDAYNHSNQQPIVELTYRIKHQNGNYCWFQTYGTVFDRNADGKVEHQLNISLDINDQVEAQRTIEAQEHFIRHIADASPTILYLFDVVENRFTYINREIYYVLGYTMEDVLEMGADVTARLYHEEDFHLLPERRESTKTFQHTDSMMQFECRLRNKDGQWCWVLVREVIFEADDDGNILQILGAALDITKRKDMEKTLLQNSFLLEQSNASLEEFAYVASHDLKEPLRKISTFGDRLVHTQLERMSDDGKVYLQKIVDASQRMQVMINDLLSISMITGDRSFQVHSLQEIFEEVLQTLEYKIEQKNAIIESDDLPEARMVPSQFRQLFQNLISNSLKFVREGVQPHVRITHAYLDQEEVPHLDAAPRYLKLDFSDNGIGFEEAYAQKIFAIFQRLHGRSEYEGTGIGLAICKKIVEHHGGIIYAHAKLGEGATFTVVLPA